jgi:type IV secretion system protein TrbL
MIPLPIPNPFDALGDVVGRATADAWAGAMLALWEAGLFLLRIVLTFADLFLTPDLSPGGPGRDVYAYALWIALALVVIMTMVQLGVAAFKREGKSLARAAVGGGQFVVVCSAWFLYCATLIAACGALTKALMKALLRVETWAGWDPLGGYDLQTVTDAGVATVLGLLGLVLWIAAIGHALVYLARAAALLVLAATGPIAAAGLVSDAGRSWFWKSLRWFHAAALTPVLMVLVLGIGVQFSTGVAAHLADDTAKSIGTALPAVMLICVSAVAPLALFKLLAFVDPGTPSGASFRQGMALQGGLQGLLTGNSSQGAVGAGGTTSAASADGNGRSSGEQGAEESTGSRFNGATQSMVGKLGPVGTGLAAGLGLLASAGAKGSSLLADESNQSGVGHQTYGPDFSGARYGQANSLHPRGRNGSDDPDDPDDDTDGAPSMPPTPSVPTIPAPNSQANQSSGQAGGDTGGKPAAPKTPAAGGGASAGAGEGGAATAGSVPPIPA